jgi:hypothetical protein
MQYQLVINSLEEGLRCIVIPVHLKTMDTLKEVNSKAMVDSGVTGNFINKDFVEWMRLPTCHLSMPIPVYNVDGSLNEAGSIDRVVDVLMTYE